MESENIDLFDPEIRKKVFILIENNGALRRAIVRSLKESGITQIIETENGKDGWSALKANSQIDFIILSDHITDVSSLKLLDGIVREKKFESTVTIIVSALGDSQNIQTAVAKGADGYIVKPFSLPSLKDRVLDAIQLKQKKLLAKYVEVSMNHPTEILEKAGNTEAQCILLSKTKCHLIFERTHLGMGDRIQFHFKKEDGSGWFEPIRGMISSTKKYEAGGIVAQVDFMNKLSKSQGVSTLLHSYLSKGNTSLS